MKIFNDLFQETRKPKGVTYRSTPIFALPKVAWDTKYKQKNDAQSNFAKYYKNPNSPFFKK